MHATDVGQSEAPLLQSSAPVDPSKQVSGPEPFHSGGTDHLKGQHVPSQQAGPVANGHNESHGSGHQPGVSNGLPHVPPIGTQHLHALSVLASATVVMLSPAFSALMFSTGVRWEHFSNTWGFSDGSLDGVLCCFHKNSQFAAITSCASYCCWTVPFMLVLP